MKMKTMTLILCTFFICAGVFANNQTNKVKVAKEEPTHVDINKQHKKVVVQWEDKSSVKYQLEASYDLQTWFPYLEKRGNLNHVTLHDTKTNQWMFFRVIKKKN